MENKNRDHVLHIPKIPQYGVIVQDSNKVGDSIFYEAYREASECVVDIIKSNDAKDNHLTKEKFVNTAIAFTGTRGSGKSSAMFTFANLLKNNMVDFWRENLPEITKKKFWVLPAIDCTQMGANEKLIASVSAKMYKEYQQKSIEGKFTTGITIDQRRNFLTLSQKVNRLSFMYSVGEWFKDESDLLQSVADVDNVGKTMHDLVKSFLTLMFGSCDEDTFLVIQVDDLDMNVDISYEIVDELRKFLTIKNVIVLTSVCMEQLKELVGLHFQEPFLKNKHGNTASNTGMVLAQKYLEKMFPIGRQIQMPTLTTEQLNKIKISNLLGRKHVPEDYDYYKAETRQSLGLDDIVGVPSEMTLTNSILHLIYRKTFLLLVPEDNDRHWLIPHNLRELCNLVYFLQEMDDVVYKVDGNRFVLMTDTEIIYNKKLVIAENNLRRLMNYIVSDMLDYSTLHMNKDISGLADVLVRTIRDLPDWTLITMNKKIVRDILFYVKDNSIYKNFYKQENIDALLTAAHYNNIISMGDV